MLRLPTLSHTRSCFTNERAVSLSFGSVVLSGFCLGCRILLLHMPPPVAHRPKHVCLNFPLCRSLQKNHDRTGFKKDKQPLFCSTHCGDPAHAASRSWNLCGNATLGCRRLSTEPSRGSCYACRAFSPRRITKPFSCAFGCMAWRACDKEIAARCAVKNICECC